MDTNDSNYQQNTDQQESPTSQTVEINANQENLEDNVNSLTPAQRRERIFSLIVIALISFLTGNEF